VAASALGFLGGYPPTWFAFAVCMLAYAAWRWKALLGVIAALGASLLIALAQLLPAWSVAALKFPELKYGTGIRDPAYLIAYVVPNYRDFAIHAVGKANDQYLYLGVPALLGLLCLVGCQRRRELIPILLMAAVVLVVVTNPGGLVWKAVSHFSLLAQICRDWYFLAGVTLAAAPLAALGLDAALGATRRRAPRWLPLAAIELLAAWSVRQAAGWLRGSLAIGWWSAVEVGVLTALCALAVYLLPGQTGRLRACLAAALLLAVGVDYKVHGTAKRFNASELKVSPIAPHAFAGMDDAVFRQLREHPEYRIAVDTLGPLAGDFRHYELSSPQGGDPFLPEHYRELMTALARFQTDRVIDLDPANEGALRLLGVRYYITAEGALHYPALLGNPRFRVLDPSTSYYKVFELRDARPPYGWEDGEHPVRPLVRTPEVRAFQVDSPVGGRFTLAEQFFPGWKATVDGAPARLGRWRGVFQAIDLPPGEHRVEFRYQTPGLRTGALLSLAALLALAALAFSTRKRG
jgi:hypothetical protein